MSASPKTSEPDAPDPERDEDLRDEAPETDDPFEGEDLPAPTPGVSSEPDVAPAGAGTPGHEDIEDPDREPAPSRLSSEPNVDTAAGAAGAKRPGNR